MPHRRARCLKASRARVRVAPEERGRHQVHALVRGLRGENRRDQQLERVRVVQLGVRSGMLTFERVENAPRVGRRLQ